MRFVNKYFYIVVNFIRPVMQKENFNVDNPVWYYYTLFEILILTKGLCKAV